jgi:HipA-like protein
MNRSGRVFFKGQLAGLLEQRASGGFVFSYLPEYLAQRNARPVSLTLPLRQTAHQSPILFPFFSGLLAEGSLKDLQCRLYRIDPDDDFTRLLKTSRHDVIGAVTVEEVQG